MDNNFISDSEPWQTRRIEKTDEPILDSASNIMNDFVRDANGMVVKTKNVVYTSPFGVTEKQ